MLSLKLRKSPKAKTTAKSPNALTRRGFLQFLAGTGIAAGLGSEEAEASAQEALQTSESTSAEDLKTPEHVEGKEKLSSTLDLSTALAIFANFSRIIFYKAAYKGESLGASDAFQMNALAQARISLLKQFGGEKGKELAETEQHEIKHGLLPVPILVALSDITTQALKVDEQKIFEQAEGAMNAEMDYSKVERPHLSEGPEVWEKHLEKANQDLRSKTAQIAAITQVLAPLFTTYTSSSLANKMKRDVLRIVYEQSYALAVIEVKNNNKDTSVIQESEIHEKAEKRADKLFNGPAGYSKLMISLAANKQGAFGLGDPPEIYFALNHSDRPETLAKAHAAGLVYGEISTFALNSLWLAQAGALSSNFAGKFLRNQGTITNVLSKTLLTGPLQERLAQLQGKDIKTQLFKALEKSGFAQAADLRMVLQQLPDSYFQLSLGNYLKNKLDVIERLSKDGQKLQHLIDASNFGVHTLEDTLEAQENFVTSKIFQAMYRAFEQGDQAELKKYSERMDKVLQDKKAEKLADLFGGLIEENGKTDQFLNTAKTVQEQNPHASPQEVKDKAIDRLTGFSSGENQAELEASLGRTLSIASEISHELLNLSTTDREDRLKKAKEALGADKTASAHKLKEILGKADKATVLQAIAQLTEITEEKDARPGLEDPHHPHPKKTTNGSEFKRKLEVLDEILGHSAKEVLWALLTQIPSVPALSRLAKLSIPKAAGVNENEKPTAEQLKMIVNVMIPIEAGMSGVADNVAAYMFAEAVLYDFFKQRYGNDVFSKKPELKGNIGIVSKKIAEAHGDVTKLGNGPNFAQEKLVIVKTDDGIIANNQGIDIDIQELKMSDTVPTRNILGSLWNGLTIVGAIKYLHHQIDLLEKEFPVKAVNPQEISVATQKSISQYI